MSIPLTLEKLKKLFSFFKTENPTTTTNPGTFLRVSRLPRAYTNPDDPTEFFHGAVEIGANITATEVEHSATTDEQAYKSTRISIPVANSTTLGLVKTGSNIVNTSGTISVDVMTGAVPATTTTAGSNGKIGLVPAPTKEQSNYFLCGDATWKPVGCYIGQIIPIVGCGLGNDYTTDPDTGKITYNTKYSPLGCVPCNGIDYTYDRDTYPTVYDEYLLKKRFTTLSFDDYNKQINKYGQCAAWGINETDKTFKVPTIKDGSFLQQALNDTELGKNYKAGLPQPDIDLLIRRDAYNSARSDYNKKYGSDADSAYGSNNADESMWNQHGHAEKALNVTFSAASGNPDVYGTTDTVQPVSTTVRYFVCLAAGLETPASMAEWTATTGALLTKANQSLSNLDAAGEARLDIKTQKYAKHSITIPDWSKATTFKFTYNSESKYYEYTPPDNGYIFYNIDSDNRLSDFYLNIYYNDTEYFTFKPHGNDAYNEGPLTVPVVKNHKIVTYTTSIFNPTFVPTKYIITDEPSYVIEDKTSTSVTTTLIENYSYIYTQNLTSLTLTFPTGSSNQNTLRLIFKSGDTATNITLNGTNFITNPDPFVPVSNKTYLMEANWFTDKWLVKFSVF